MLSAASVANRSDFWVPKAPFPPESLAIFPCDCKEKTSPLQFARRRGRLRQKIVAIRDCDLGALNLHGVYYAAPIGTFFCPEIRAFREFRGEISSTVSKVLSDRKVIFKHKNGR